MLFRHRLFPSALSICILRPAIDSSPIVRGGAGELLFRGILGYVSGLQGQQQPCVDSLWHCADILVKSPGLCRFSAW